MKGLLIEIISTTLFSIRVSIEARVLIPLTRAKGVCLVIFLILIITSWRLLTLYQRSKKNNSTNAFSSIFYVLIWIILWFRSFSFLNSLLNVTQASTDPDIVSSLIDILLLFFTAVMVLRGLGEKVYDSFIFNANNMPFFLFAFTVLYKLIQLPVVV